MGATDLPDNALYDVPAVGACGQWSRPYNLQKARWVACNRRHQTSVYYVGLQPHRLRSDFGVASKKLSVYANRECLRNFTRVVPKPTNRNAVMLAWVVYFPNADQAARGAAWFACHTYNATTPRGRPLPGAGPTYWKGSNIPRSLQRCIRVVGSSWKVKPCSAPHTHRFLRAVKHSGARYPGDRALSNYAKDNCPSGFVMWPQRTSWQIGDRSITCWVSG